MLKNILNYVSKELVSYMGGIADDSSGILLNFIAFIISLALCALFSFLETSMMALRLFQLEELAQKTGKYKALFKSLEKDPNRLLNALLIAYNLVNTIATMSGTVLVEEILKHTSLPDYISYIIEVVVITAVLLLIGDIIPKNVVKFRGEKFFASSLWLTNLTFYTLYPFVTLLGFFTNAILRFIVGPTENAAEQITSEKEIQYLIGYIDEKGLMEREKTSMLQSIFRLSTTSARDILVPAPEIVMIEAQQSINDAHQLFNRCQFSRFPVYKGDPNNVIGMLHFKDLLPQLSQNNADKPVKDFMRPILFIPESIRINQILQEFKSKHMHIAMIINEHGSITGMVTLEDILEEIVGEIHDEYESITEKIYPLPSGGWLADGSIELEKLASVLKIQFDRSSNITTLGGFLIEQLQRLPKRGEKLHYKGYVFLIQQVTKTKIVQVLIKPADNEATQLMPVE